MLLIIFMMMLYLLVVYLFLFARPSPPAFLRLFLAPAIQVGGALVLLLLAGGLLVLYLRLPTDHPAPWYTPALSFSWLVAALLAILLLIVLFVPVDRHLLLGQQGILQFVLLGIFAVPLMMVSVTLTERKQKRLNGAEARADLLRTYLQLQVITITSQRLLKYARKPEELEEANAAAIPRFFLARHAERDYTVAFSADLPVSLARQLAAIPPEKAFIDQERIKHILAEDVPCDEVWAGRLYTFPDTITRQDYPDVVALPAIPQSDEASEYVLSDQAGYYFARLIDEKIVAFCRTRRVSQMASEAWVQPAPINTDEARQVTLAWAHAQQQNGRVPFFIRALDDTHAAALARRLGLRQVIELVEYY
jgi:hypothetical protein